MFRAKLSFRSFLTVLVALLVNLLVTFAAADIPALAAQKVYKQALPGYQYKFPQDHYSHDQFRTEWWYYTGHLLTEDKRRFGYELTFFRTGADNEPTNKQSPWKLDNFYLAHFAITDENGKKFRYTEKLNRSGLKLAGARQDAYYVHNEGWSVEKVGEHYLLRADSPEYSIHLVLDSLKKPIVHGSNGVSQKASCVGCASHYYSMTRLKTEGTLFIGDKPYAVTGTSWMDHEFGSNQLTSDQAGWDWYSIQLDDNRELMFYLMRRGDGSFEKESSGTIVNADGSFRHLTLADFSAKPTGSWVSVKTKGKYPMGWKLSVPSAAVDIELTPTMVDQELVTGRSTAVTYWEGSVSVKGTSNGKSVTGQGYVEMTGYAEKFKQKL